MKLSGCVSGSGGRVASYSIRLTIGNGSDWTYICTTYNFRLAGDKISLLPIDNPANLSKEEILLQ